MKSVAIVLMSILAAVLYGILHDQVTARICIEYFTIGHPPIFHTDSPALLGLGWGIVATWWVGLFLGIPLAVSARYGDRPKREPATLIRPLLILQLVTAGGAALSGLIGFLAAKNGWLFLLEPFASQVPEGKHIRFLVALWIHSASYLIGLLGGIVLIRATWASRQVTAKVSATGKTRKMHLRYTACFLLGMIVLTGSISFWIWNWNRNYRFVNAARYGDLSAVRAYVQAGTDVNATSLGGMNALKWAAYEGHEDIVRFLLDNGADPTSSLYQAILMKRTRIVKLLIEKGANVNAKQGHNATPLQFAKELEASDIIKLLEKAGAKAY